MVQDDQLRGASLEQINQTKLGRFLPYRHQPYPQQYFARRLLNKFASKNCC
jgi:hypothetical protein